MPVNIAYPDYIKMTEVVIRIAEHYAKHKEIATLLKEPSYVHQVKGLREAASTGLVEFVDKIVDIFEGGKKERK